jgi:uncharacterized protein (DUF1015 family)
MTHELDLDTLAGFLEDAALMGFGEHEARAALNQAIDRSEHEPDVWPELFALDVLAHRRRLTGVRVA